MVNSTIFNPQPAILNPQPTILNPQPTILNPQPAILNSQPAILNPQPVSNHLVTGYKLLCEILFSYTISIYISRSGSIVVGRTFVISLYYSQESLYEFI